MLAVDREAFGYRETVLLVLDFLLAAPNHVGLLLFCMYGVLKMSTVATRMRADSDAAAAIYTASSSQCGRSPFF